MFLKLLRHTDGETKKPPCGVHDRAAVIIDAEGRGDRAKGRGGDALPVYGKDHEAMARTFVSDEKW